MNNTAGWIVVMGMLIAVIGIGHLGENGRLLAWGFALSIGVLAHWVNALQNQINELKSDRNQKEQPGDRQQDASTNDPAAVRHEKRESRI